MAAKRKKASSAARKTTRKTARKTARKIARKSGEEEIDLQRRGARPRASFIFPSKTID